jgi:hypothetical protein
MLRTNGSSPRRSPAGYCFVCDCERVRVTGGARAAPADRRVSAGRVPALVPARVFAADMPGTRSARKGHLAVLDRPHVAPLVSEAPSTSPADDPSVPARDLQRALVTRSSTRLRTASSECAIRVVARRARRRSGCRPAPAQAGGVRRVPRLTTRTGIAAAARSPRSRASGQDAAHRRYSAPRAGSRLRSGPGVRMAGDRPTGAGRGLVGLLAHPPGATALALDGALGPVQLRGVSARV